MVEQVPVFHLKSRILLNNLPFHLELDDRDRFVHLDIYQHLILPVAGISLQLETAAGVVSVHIHGECGKRQKIDPISLLQDIQIAVSCADPDHIGDTAALACCRAHPQYVMISPLDVHGMMLH